MNKEQIIEQVYEVFQEAIPAEKHLFSARQSNLITMLTIRKAFKTYDNFLKAYHTYCINERAKKVEVVTKPTTGAGVVTKDGKNEATKTV